MKFVVLGTSEFTLACIRALLDSEATVCAWISLPQDQLPNNSIDVGAAARENGIPYEVITDVNSAQSLDTIRSYEPDFLYSSWPKILQPAVLKIPRASCIGTHPTDLPFNRGRHPLHWLVAMGINDTKLSFFRMDSGIDTGNVLLQIPFSVGESIASAVSSMNEAAYQGTKRLYSRLVHEPQWQGIGQDHGAANYWRKRTLHDITLDPRMSASMVLRTVRSFTMPYPCANLIFREYVIKIHSGNQIDLGISRADLGKMEPGKIIAARDRRLRLKVDDAIVELESVDVLPLCLRRASYIHPPSRYFEEWGSELTEKLHCES